MGRKMKSASYPYGTGRVGKTTLTAAKTNAVSASGRGLRRR